MNDETAESMRCRMDSPAEFAKSASLERAEDERRLAEAITARDAEHRAELDRVREKCAEEHEQKSDFFRAREELATACAEIERLKGELAEAKRARIEPPTCYSIDCRYYGQRHATPHESREGEPGTHICPNDYGGPCFHASHKKGAKL